MPHNNTTKDIPWYQYNTRNVRKYRVRGITERIVIAHDADEAKEIARAGGMDPRGNPDDLGPFSVSEWNK